MNFTLVSDLLRQASIKTENHLMEFSDSCWQDCPDTGRSSVSYIIFDQGWPIHHGTHDPGPVSQSIAESEYNSACTTGVDLEYFRMLFHEFLNKDPDIVPEEDPLIVLGSKYVMCMAKNGKDTKYTRHIARIIHFVSNGEKWKMHNIYWCERSLQLSYMATKNIGDNDLTLRMTYTMVKHDNLDVTPVQQWWQNTGYSIEQEFYINRID